MSSCSPENAKNTDYDGLKRDAAEFGRQLYSRHNDEFERMGLVQKSLAIAAAAITAFAWVLLGGHDE